MNVECKDSMTPVKDLSSRPRKSQVDCVDDSRIAVTLYPSSVYSIANLRHQRQRHFQSYKIN